MTTPPEFLHFLRTSSEADLLEVLPYFSRSRLLLAQRYYGFPDCNCELEITPCFMHALFEEWHDEGYSPQELADMWRRKTRQRVPVEDIEKYFERQHRDFCDCPVAGRLVPCPHVLQQEFCFSFPVQVLLLDLLDLEEYRERPEALFPFDNGDHKAQVEKMVERVQDHKCRPFHEGDTISRFPERFVRQAAHGANGQPAGPKGVSLAGDYYREGGAS